MLGRNSCSWPKRRKGETKGGKEGHLRVGGDFEDGRKGTLKERPREGGAPRQVSTHAQEGGEHGRATAGLCGQTWRAQLMGKREAGAWCKTSLSKSESV